MGNVCEHSARNVLQCFEHRAGHAHEAQLNRRAQSSPSTKTLAQGFPIPPGKREEMTHLECAQLPRETAPSQIRPQQRAHRRSSHSMTPMRIQPACLDRGLPSIAPQQRNRDSLHERYATPYQRVFALAERAQGRTLSRALVPRIQLQGPKITRALTTNWYAHRVEDRFERCMGR